MRWVEAARVEDVPRGGGRAVVVGERAIALFEVGGAIHAIEDRCPHQFAPLSTGRLCGSVVECALHGWKIDVTTGKPPLGKFPRVASFPVRVEAGVVYVGL